MPTIELCKKCGRERPRVITDPSCHELGYCDWTTIEIAQKQLDRARPPISTKRENVKKALEQLALVLKPFPTSSEKFSIAVVIDMLLDALEL